MKKINFKLILTVVLFTTLSLCQAQTDFALGRVNKNNNKLVFYYNEPVNEYEVAFTFENEIANLYCLTPASVCSESVKNANYEAGNQSRLYDAIILGAGRDQAIIWKDKTKDNAIARVKKQEGKLFFVECEPLANYDIVEKYNVSGVGQQILLGSCPTTQAKIDKLLKKAGKDKKDYDAILYGSSKNDMTIKFK